MSLQQLAATPLPIGFDDSALYLRTWLLNLRLRLSAEEVKRYNLLKAALRELVAEQFQEALEALVDDASDQLFDRLKVSGCEIPDEFEADEPDFGDLDLPDPE